jgi:hypothetical protein
VDEQELPIVLPGQNPNNAPVEHRAPVYICSDARELRQAEIISGLSQFEFDPDTRQAVEIQMPHGIVLAQDCDLLRDYEAELGKKTPILNGVLIYEIELASEARRALQQGISWQPVTQNINERFHHLPAVPRECDALNVGLPELLIDFRRYFTLSVKEIYRQCERKNGASRRCRLETPYREHLQNRAAFYFQRIALP